MVKNILAVVAGVIGGAIVIWLLEALGHLIVPPPEGMDILDIESVRKHMTELPLISFIMVLVAYAAGSLTGGMLASGIAEKMKMRQALIAGVVLQFMGIINLILVPHPLWFTIVSLLLYLPLAYLGGRIMLR